jgi:hypothetical protein
MLFKSWEGTMSINSLVNSAIARRTDFPPFGKAPQTYAEIAWAANNPPLHAAAPAAPNGPAPSAAPVDTTMNVITNYIPAEILTCYVAVLAALQSTATPTPTPGPQHASPEQWIAFGLFQAATPIVFWLVYAAKLKGAGKNLPLSFAVWPLWEMVASAIAFFAWAFGLPNSPFFYQPWYSSAIAAIVVLLASTTLALLAPIFGGSPLKAS